MPPSSSPQISTSTFHYLYTTMVHYYLHGHGTRYFQPSAEELPPSDTIPKDLLSLKRTRIENIAIDIGSRYVRTLSPPQTATKSNGKPSNGAEPSVNPDLDIVKFICKNFWESLFNKQIDVLRTNHKGLYVLTDNKFRWIENISPEEEDGKGKDGENGMGRWEAREDFVVFPCGLIQGALQGVGIRARVSAEIASKASAKVLFNVQMIK